MDVSDAQRFRLALAVVAVRHKPRGQSVAAYILDIRSRFPIRSGAEDSCGEDPWRERAMKLEEEVKTLKRKLDGGNSALQASASAAEQIQDPLTRTPSNPTPKKKKCKANATGTIKQQASIPVLDVDIQTEVRNALQGLDNGSVHPPLTDAMRIFITYQKLHAASQPQDYTLDMLRHFLFSAVDLVESLGILLQTAMHSRRILKNPLDAVRAVDVILQSSMTSLFTVLSLSKARRIGKKSEDLYRHSPLYSATESFFGSLFSTIVDPIVQSFRGLSERIVLSTLPEAKPSKRKSRSACGTSFSPSLPDIRPGLLTLIKRMLSTLQEADGSLLPHSGEIMDMIVHSAVTEIPKLWMIGCSILENTSDGQSFAATSATHIEQATMIPERARLSRDGRIRRLARKDTLWYLSAIAHDALIASASYRVSPRNTERTHSEIDEFVQDKIAGTLSSLLVHCTKGVYHEDSGLCADVTDEIRGQMDETEKGIVMGLVERAWLGNVHTLNSTTV